MPSRILKSVGVLVSALMMLATPLSALAQAITVNKTPWCGCCTKWVDHLRDNGFEVEVHEHENLTPVRQSLGVPDELMSCHTAEVEGYTLEGHVPAQEIHRLLAERPEAIGLSVPGMPMGSPGMETPYEPDTYDVVLFAEDGTETFARYTGNAPVELTAE